MTTREVEEHKDRAYEINFNNSMLKSLNQHKANKISFGSSDLQNTSRSLIAHKVTIIQRAVRKFINHRKKYNKADSINQSEEFGNNSSDDIDLHLSKAVLNNSKEDTLTSYGVHKDDHKNTHILEVTGNETASINFSTHYALSLQNIREMKEKILKDVEKNISEYKYDKIIRNQNEEVHKSLKTQDNETIYEKSTPRNDSHIINDTKLKKNMEYSPFDSIVSDDNDPINFQNTSRSNIMHYKFQDYVNVNIGSQMTERVTQNKSSKYCEENKSPSPQPYLRARADLLHSRMISSSDQIRPEETKTFESRNSSFCNVKKQATAEKSDSFMNYSISDEDLEQKIRESIRTFKDSQRKNNQNLQMSGLHNYSNSKSYDNSNAEMIDMLIQRHTGDEILFNIDDSCEESEINSHMVALLKSKKNTEWIDIPILTDEQILKVFESLD